MLTPRLTACHGITAGQKGRDVQTTHVSDEVLKNQKTGQVAGFLFVSNGQGVISWPLRSASWLCPTELSIVMMN